MQKVFNTNINNETNKNNYKLANNIFLSFDYEFKWPSKKNNKIKEIGSCEGLKTQIGILVDGTVVPCCLDNNGDVNLGNIFLGDLNIILNSKRAKNMLLGFNQNKLTEELCQKGEYRS